MQTKNISVIGAGGWGNTLALLLHSKGYNVTLWEFFPDYAEHLDKIRENTKFLPGIKIPNDIFITSNISKAVPDRDVLVMAVPSHIMRSACSKLKDFDLSKTVLVSVAKGIENDSLKRMSEVIAESLPQLKESQIAVLSGPSHAEEVSRKIPTAIVIASFDLNTAKMLQEVFSSREYSFRVYSASDVVGVEVGGSLKNVIAIAAGICDGAGFGDNTKAALMTRGLVEIARLGVAMGGKRETFAGLSGMGDLIVTCMSRHSRNRYVGEEIGKGKKLKDVLSGMVMVAEGVKTSKSTYDLSQKFNIQMPITTEVYKVLFEDKNPHDAVADLMTRDLKEEI